MVSGASDTSAAQAAAVHRQPVRTLFHFAAQRAQPPGNHSNPIRLLHPQLCRIADHRLAFGGGRDHAQDRQLVDHPRDQAAADADAAQPLPAHGHRSHRLSRILAGLTDVRLRTQRAQHVEEPGPRRIQSHVFDGELRPRHGGGCRQQERRRGDIAADPHLMAPQGSRRDTDAVPVAPDGRPECRQHPFGVIPGRRGLHDRRRTLRQQPSEQHRRLHLRAGDRQCVGDPPQGSAGNPQGREPPVTRRDNPRAHPRQRLHDAIHQPGPERRVASQLGLEGLPGQDPRQQPHRGSRVSRVQRSHRGAPPRPHSAHDETAALVLDPHAQRAQAADRVQAVVGA